MLNYLHNHPEFNEVLRAVEHQKNIDHNLIEKDYWIMNCLYGLQQEGFEYELKGGTSLSKGYGIIHRFSEDIDIVIEPPADMKVPTGKNHTKPAHCESRRKYYDWLADKIKIDGIKKVARDKDFDNERTYFSGGIRLYYKESIPAAEGIKEGVLLEVGFDDVIPYKPRDISSWAFDFAHGKGMKIKDNRAFLVRCYDPGHTFVEKLQTIVTKFRIQQETGILPSNFMRHYYDVYCLLENDAVKNFIGTPEYEAHKKKRFPAKDQLIPLSKQEAFQLNDPGTRKQFEGEYQKSRALYYQGQPSFEEILNLISRNLVNL